MCRCDLGFSRATGSFQRGLKLRAYLAPEIGGEPGAGFFLLCPFLGKFFDFFIVLHGCRPFAVLRGLVATLGKEMTVSLDIAVVPEAGEEGVRDIGSRKAVPLRDLTNEGELLCRVIVKFRR